MLNLHFGGDDKIGNDFSQFCLKWIVSAFKCYTSDGVVDNWP